MKLVNRTAWGARRPTGETPFPGPLRGLTVHWGGPPAGTGTHDKCDDIVRMWQKYHMDTKKWDDIAYNWVVCPHGYVYVGRGPRNRSAANGTNAGNQHWLAVCYLGGKGEPFTEEAKAAILELKKVIKAPALNGHRDHKSTECPGHEIYSWLRAGAPAPGPTPEPKKPTPAPTPTPEEEDAVRLFVFTGPDFHDYSTDLHTCRRFDTQADKQKWIDMVQAKGGTVTRINLSHEEFHTLIPLEKP